mmetsp:Transcript_28490/g.64509  ORF Transcript_28490/g.64509 Transcript_28490/m.64509 type:complete len:206 (-) Transcript_28490:3-620(-)
MHWYVCVSQKETSVPAATVSIFWSRESSTELTPPSKSILLTSASVLTSHTLTLLSSDPVRNVVGCGRKRTTLMVFVCPVTMRGSLSGWLMSNMRSFASFPPVTSVLLSADQSAARTMCRCLSSRSSSPVIASQTLAEKSPEHVATRVAGALSAAPQTAPLCPSKVPIQSPVSPERSIAVLSWQAEMRKTPSSVTSENSIPATGRE